MGFMTEICFLNDGWHNLKAAIKKDPGAFTDEIEVLMNGRYQDGGREYPGDLDRLMRIGGGSTVYPSHHADEARLYFAHQNSFINLDPYSLAREFEGRFERGDKVLLDALESDVKLAQRTLNETKKLLKHHREQQAETE